MQIQVKLYATLIQLVPQALAAGYGGEIRAGTPLRVTLPNKSTLADLMDHLGLPREKVRVVFVNGRAQDMGYVLKPGDEIGIFPPVGGG